MQNIKNNTFFPFYSSDISFWMHYGYEEEKYPLFFIRLLSLTNREILQLLRLFDRFYGNINQETTEWTLEYQLLTRNLINGGRLLVNPKYLDISKKEISILIWETIPVRDRKVWDTARRCSREDIWAMFQQWEQAQEGFRTKQAAVLNTRITYLYRNANNFKVWNEAVIEGVLTDEQQKTILSCLDKGKYFIPSQVGLPGERFSSVTEDDHNWFELDEGFAEPTDRKATEELTVDSLVRNFLAAKGWWRP